MKRLVPSKDNSIEPRGAIGRQKCGIIFWQKTGFLRHCNKLGFQAIITLIGKNFAPSRVELRGESCFIQFDNDDEKIIYLSLKKECNSRHRFLYGECHTAYISPDFHLFALRVINYIGQELGCRFFVDDATDYLTHRSTEKLSEYIANLRRSNHE